MAAKAPSSLHAHLLPPAYKRQISYWLEEDCPSLDVGGFVVGDTPGEARLLCKSPGVVAGVPFFDEVFAQLDCTVEWHVREGEKITAKDAAAKRHCATVRGSMRKILLGERVGLNLLARCSGIASRSVFSFCHQVFLYQIDNIQTGQIVSSHSCGPLHCLTRVH